MTHPVLIEEHAGVAIITLNRPELRNAISSEEMISGIEQAVRRLNADHAVRAAVITGAGAGFSSGGNVRDMAARDGFSQMDAWRVRNGYEDGIQRIPRAITTLRVPLIAAVNGPAIGAGFDLSCMADIRIASTKAKFGATFVKLGIIPGDGGVAFLRRAIGASRAAEMIFTGDLIDAGQALAWGLVSRVVEPEELLPMARDLAGRIAANPTSAVRLAKRLMQTTEGAGLETILELSACMQSLAHGTPDHREAVTAFVEKRPPVFRHEP
ncbi:MAG: crotonase/enoyl-CoA hydratase family protein [Rhodospirillales bacterium]|nr:crotonase/enoyl-CoA hydratase family protein [Rhodospirillales bacterium]MDE2200170.1 crotonase/enoyl-CoA hydratase family protein [Rhodospirillales bacterium]